VIEYWGGLVPPHFFIYTGISSLYQWLGESMTKSDLIEILASKHIQFTSKEIESAIKEILEQMTCSLQEGDRIEIRGFGSFSLHFRAPRVGRNPKTGEKVELSGKHVPHFKPGKELRERVNASL
jgi:integration host factor subunit beta